MRLPFLACAALALIASGALALPAEQAGGTDKGQAHHPQNGQHSAPIRGCPPEIAQKHNGCKAPDLTDTRELDLFGRPFTPALFGLAHYGTGHWLYDAGYLLRLGDGGAIDGYIPLPGGALTVGSGWPRGYPAQPLPRYHQDYYNLGSPDRYRYADHVIYRFDLVDESITSVAALLTGDEFAVGQPLPPGYDVYNVPALFRDRYYDTPDAHYRYADGYVYQVDPGTQRVAAVVSLLI